ncbi:hypothetical protein [Paracraurococcus ruber]|uniref:Uncharacterized protein n=1 Tax=Paracraurococcus ruber TaxID=77675 RepID=A0ABS1D6R8_9PROT|nr:hypothetical protein [Paracraurococcus ruber]MBK1661957.1 hypothetical protein [Paracraurococcus ruber]
MVNALREIRQLRQSVAGADDSTVLRLARMLDALPVRGEVDALLEPVRPRLAALGITRPLRLARLLFLPLDGAVVPARAWARGTPTLPRSAIPVLAAILLADPEGAAVALAAEGHSLADREVVAALGARVWHLAARVLPDAVPPDWNRTGLTAADYAPILALCRPAWQAGPVIWDAVALADQGPPEQLAERALRAVAAAGPMPLAATLATLARRASAPGALAVVAAGVSPSLRGPAVQLLETILKAPPPEFGQLDPRRAADLALATARRLDDLEACPLLAGDRQAAVRTYRRAADEACRAAFAEAAQAELAGPAARLAAAPEVTEAEVAAMEQGARRLRALESAGRRIGGAAAYDRAIRDMVAQLRGLGQSGGGPGGLTRIDVLRSIEILAGSDAAEALLQGG